MLDLLFSLQGVTSFWFPLLVAFIIFVLQLLVNSNKKGGDKQNASPQTFTQVNYVVQQQVNVNRSSATRTRSKREDGGPLAVLFLATLFFEKHEAVILQTMVALTVFVFAFWMFSIIDSFCN